MSKSEHCSAAPELSTRVERRHDVDALRVILFGLLIWLHYVSLCTWTQEPVPLHTNKPALLVMSIMHQWRLAALFVISGMGTAFAFGRRTWQTYLKERVVRLLIPLLFATYVLLGGFVNPADTTARFFEIFPGMGRMPYGHLWFIYNLLIYSVVLTPLFVYVRRNSAGRLVDGLRRLMSMPFATGLLIVPPLLFTASDILCKPWARGEVGMWWEFPRYFLYFAVGYLLISARKEYFAALERVRYALIPLTVVMTIIFIMSESIFGVPDLAIGGWVKLGHPAF
jgi:glucan biosynthesis protein C